MRIVNDVLLSVGLYAPLPEIVNAYAWDSHMEAKWKERFTEGICDKIIYYMSQLNNYIYGQTPKRLLATVLVAETRGSMVFYGKTESFSIYNFTMRMFSLHLECVHDYLWLNRDYKIMLTYRPDIWENLPLPSEMKSWRILIFEDERFCSKCPAKRFCLD